MIARVVIDTNVYVSRALRENSLAGRAVDRAWLEGTTLLSAATFAELRVVLMREKFARYILPGSLEPYLERVRAIAEIVMIPSPIRACRDPHDDKFLEAAVHGLADAIVTGDEDLLALNPFRGIAILSPANYLAQAE
jgi:putative PIN family toxin of toxin-antitoxin system